MTLTALGIAPKVIASSVVGSAVGMVLGTGRWWERVARGVIGCAVALIGYPIGARLLGAVLDIALPDKWMPPMADLDALAGLTFGLVGMIACQAAINAVTAIRDHADDFVEDHMGGDSK